MLYYFYLVSPLLEKKNLAHSGIVVWSQNPKLSDLQVLNGKGRHNFLFGTTPTYVKRGRVSLQRYGFCIGAHGKQIYYCFSDLNVKVKRSGYIFLGSSHSACTCKRFGLKYWPELQTLPYLGNEATTRDYIPTCIHIYTLCTYSAKVVTHLCMKPVC